MESKKKNFDSNCQEYRQKYRGYDNFCCAYGPIEPGDCIDCPESKRVYLASTFENADKVSELASHLEKIGYEIAVKWWLKGDFKNLIDDDIPGWFRNEEVARIYCDDLTGIDNCDIFILLFPDKGQPPLRGGYVELGMASVLGKKIYIVDANDKSAMFCGADYFMSFDEIMEKFK